MTIAALVVTHQSQDWIGATLESILNQTQPVDRVVLVDDGSTDRTRSIARELVGARVQILSAQTQAPDAVTRIAANFRQGLRACRQDEAVILGDHDDLWLPHRVEHQVRLLRAHQVDMVAGDGLLIDESGGALPGTLRKVFPVPGSWMPGSAAERMRIALRCSIATGGASALRPGPFTEEAIPQGWLHDRWWSLMATARERMLLDDSPVIAYRVFGSQQVGLDRGLQASSTVGRLRHAITELPATRTRLADLRNGLGPVATHGAASQLRGLRLLRNLR